jgi:DNA invertase Pin-like site-specific DNA recombinase
MNTQKYTILYERLSRDDGEDSISNSIKNQQDLLQEYAERNGLTPYIHVFDDGYSGTGWNRPGWLKVIEEIEAGRVKTLVIKNLDRMGRDYLRVGLYLEQFQSAGVRLIAISDGIDTASGEDDFTPLRALFAEWFARDTSKKIKAVVNAKGRSGKPTANIPPYGYIKDTNDKNRWLVDSPAADVVRRIFNMTLDGIGPYEIARTLTAEKVESPSYYLGSRGRGNRKNNYDKDNPYTWWCSQVTNIIRKPEYAGHTANFKTRRENFKSKKATIIPPEEWLIFENTHESIVSQEVFDTAQKLRGTPRRVDRFGEANPLTGILFCADCGAKMYNHRKQKPTMHNKNGKTYAEKPQDIYQCSNWKLNKTKFRAACSAHHIQTVQVRRIILEILRDTSNYVREHEDDFLERVRAQSAVRQGETAKKHKKQITKNEKRIAELNTIYRSLYEDKALGKLPEGRFAEMAAGYEHEQTSLKEQTASLQSELDAFHDDSIRADKFIELVRRFTHFGELTNGMINEFVDKVIIHEGVWSESEGNYKGSRTQEIDVYLKYIGKFDVPDLRSAEEIEAERIAWEKAEERRRINRERMREKTAAKRAAEETAKPAA